MKREVTMWEDVLMEYSTDYAFH